MLAKSCVNNGIKLTVYKSLLAPIWITACIFYGSAKPSNLKNFKLSNINFQSNYRCANVSNLTLRNDLKIPFT